MLRPKTAILRPVATAASAACCSLKILEAKEAKIIRPSIFSKIFKMEVPIIFSDLVNVGISAFVLSDNRHNTPSSPIRAILCKLAGSPTGVKSNLKSPV